MTWEEAEQLMIKRGYLRTGVLRHDDGAGEIDKMIFRKEFEPAFSPDRHNYTIAAEVTTESEPCDNCWKVRLRFPGLKLMMCVDSMPFSLTHTDFKKIEIVLFLYAEKCMTINPDQFLKYIK